MASQWNDVSLGNSSNGGLPESTDHAADTSGALLTVESQSTPLKRVVFENQGPLGMEFETTAAPYRILKCSGYSQSLGVATGDTVVTINELPVDQLNFRDMKSMLMQRPVEVVFSPSENSGDKALSGSIVEGLKSSVLSLAGRALRDMTHRESHDSKDHHEGKDSHQNVAKDGQAVISFGQKSLEGGSRTQGHNSPDSRSPRPEGAAVGRDTSPVHEKPSEHAAASVPALSHNDTELQILKDQMHTLKDQMLSLQHDLLGKEAEIQSLRYELANREELMRGQAEYFQGALSESVGRASVLADELAILKRELDDARGSQIDITLIPGFERDIARLKDELSIANQEREALDTLVKDTLAKLSAEQASKSAFVDRGAVLAMISRFLQGWSEAKSESARYECKCMLADSLGLTIDERIGMGISSDGPQLQPFRPRISGIGALFMQFLNSESDPTQSAQTAQSSRPATRSGGVPTS